MNEAWKDIEGYETLYQVSSQGRVKNIPRNKLLKADKTSDGYLRVKLSKDGVAKNFRVHRLVAKAFIDNPSGLEEVNHKDEDKANNKVYNLEWCTREYNQRYGNHDLNMRLTKIRQARSK